MVKDMLDSEASAAEGLLSAGAVRDRCRMVLRAGLEGGLEHFELREANLDKAADYVADTIRRNYPSLQVPFHSRWRHFVFDGEDRWASLGRKLAADIDERARIRFDLAVTSVLLDAGSGPLWRWQDPVSGSTVARSEGLALASLEAFRTGLFSTNPRQLAQADAPGLMRLSTARLAAALQVSGDNRLDGLEGRVALLNRLGAAIVTNPEYFGAGGRIGGLFDHLKASARNGRICAPDILAALLRSMGSIWPGRLCLGGVNLGDTWRHPAVRVSGSSNGLVPFHKLSQWLAYSLTEPIEEAGLQVVDIGGLTGLAEYRNGGLFLDLDVVTPRRHALLARPLEPGAECVVEWRALTVALLDRIAPLVRERLGLDAAAMPLACVLEGGTWAAGRRIAREKRADGGPPVTIISDGSVF